MKLYKQDINGQKKRRLNFATNVDEMELISAILTESGKYFPRIPSTIKEYSLLHSIIRGINKGLKQSRRK